MQINRIILSVVFFLLSPLLFAQLPTAREAHNLLAQNKYSELIEAIEKGLDPLSPIVVSSGRRRLFKRPTSSREDLLEKTLLKKATPDRNRLIDTIKKYYKQSSFVQFHDYYNKFFRNKDNWRDNETIQWLFNKSTESDNFDLSSAVEARQNLLIKLCIDKYGVKRFQTELAVAAVNYDSIPLLNWLIEKVGIYPTQKGGLKPHELLKGVSRIYTDSYITTINILKENGASFETRDKEGNTILAHAVQFNDDNLFYELINRVNVNFFTKNNKGQNLLHLAVFKRNLELIKYLLEKGVSTEEKDKEENYPRDLVLKEDLLLKSLLKSSQNTTEQNTQFLLEVASKSSTEVSEADYIKIQEIIQSDSFHIKVVTRTKYEYGYDNNVKKFQNRLVPIYEDLISVAEKNQSWQLFSLLYQNKLFDNKPNVFTFEYDKISDSDFFRYMLPIDKKIGKDLFDRWRNNRLKGEREGYKTEITNLILSDYLTRENTGSYIEVKTVHGENIFPNHQFLLLEKLNQYAVILAKTVEGWGAINIKGKEIIPFEYDSLQVVNITKQSGESIQLSNYIAYYAYKNGVKLILELGTYNDISKINIPLTATLVQKVYVNTKPFLIIEDGNKYGLIKFGYSTNQVLPNEFDEIIPITYHHLAIRKGNKWSVFKSISYSKKLNLKVTSYFILPTIEKSSKLKKMKFRYDEVVRVNDTTVKARIGDEWTVIH